MYRNQIRAAALTAGLLLTTVVGAQTATAKVDPGLPLPPLPGITSASAAKPAPECPLRRVGTQLVRSDDLTGGFAVAGRHIPERG